MKLEARKVILSLFLPPKKKMHLTLKLRNRIEIIKNFKTRTEKILTEHKN